MTALLPDSRRLLMIAATDKREVMRLAARSCGSQSVGKAPNCSRSYRCLKALGVRYAHRKSVSELSIQSYGGFDRELPADGAVWQDE